MRTAAATLLLSTLVLEGCPVYQLNQRPESTPLPRPSPISSSGDFTHVPSRYTFPSSVSGFNRVQLMQYDSGGLDISAGYNGGPTGCPVSLTIYVAPTPRMSFIGADPAVVHSLEANWLHTSYEHWKHEIAQQHPQAVLTSEDESTRDGIPERKAVYAMDSDQSELVVSVVEHSWILTYRDTYRSSCAPRAKTLIQDFFANWPGRSS
jgi:hypothetical protein